MFVGREQIVELKRRIIKHALHSGEL